MAQFASSSQKLISIAGIAVQHTGNRHTLFHLFQGLTLSRRTTYIYIYIYICRAVSPLNSRTATKVVGGGGDLILAAKG